jgi:cyclic pyranopterin phosphate synthase
MPESDYVWLPRKDILTFEEISLLLDVFINIGVDKVRITGGEPLLRTGLPILIKLIAEKSSINDLALTTNGLLLGEHASALRAAGLNRITVSLDTLHADRFHELTRFDSIDLVKDGLKEAACVGFDIIKIDTVVIKGVNDDELADIIKFSCSLPAEVRFIEYMDVGGATRWSLDNVVSRAEILHIIENKFGSATPIVKEHSATADRFQLADGTTFGIISSTTSPFCNACNRSRLTADGLWYLCLYAITGTNLRQLLRDGASVNELGLLIKQIWQMRSDRGAEVRLETKNRQPLISTETLKKEPHLEMHTRGG